MEKLSPNELLSVLFTGFHSEEPCIIYVGVGTHCYSESWEINFNQQFPVFIRDWKLSNLDTKIKIILFDKETKDSPYIVSLSTDFYAGSFVNDKYSNVFTSDLGIEVYSFDFDVEWDTGLSDYSILDLMIRLILKTCESNYLLFYQEYTGRNCSLFDTQIRQIIEYDENKVCIDITRGQDLSCYFDLSLKENYPLIKLCEGKLSWLNSKFFCLPYSEFKNFESFVNTDNSSDPYSSSEDFILHQIAQFKNKKNFIIDYCKKIITIMRLCYTDNLNITFYKSEYINKIKIGEIYIREIKEYLKQVCENLLDYKLEKKFQIIELLKHIIKTSILNITDVDNVHFIELFENFDVIEDKFKLYQIFNNFYSMVL